MSVLGKKLAEGEDGPADMRIASRSSQGRAGSEFLTKKKERNLAVDNGLMPASNKNNKNFLLFLGTASQL